MAIAELNPAFVNLKGKIGNMVYYNSFGTLRVRSRTIPRNPKTPAQQANRRTFADAVKAWQVLSPEEKTMYNKRGLKNRLRGYNFFISEYIKGRASTVILVCSRQSASMQPRYTSVTAPLLQAYSSNTASIQQAYSRCTG